MKIAIASDHGGYELKSYIIKQYANSEHQFTDLGTHNEESCDYPLIADKMADYIVNKKADLGILVCGSGIGISIAANRHKGIRAALLYNEQVAALAKEHNNANVAVFGGRTQSKEEVMKYLDIFLNTEFSNGERHLRRITQMG
ncbi:MAG: RpiB/LacA/LacB family sugar-phosphate isomerase [Alphaproteobacteria bacterium]|nr:RpiB/LacA/LacB family sugar-phosphate isomerase [Alphaproteobacteria bacterium]